MNGTGEDNTDDGIAKRKNSKHGLTYCLLACLPACTSLSNRMSLNLPTQPHPLPSLIHQQDVAELPHSATSASLPDPPTGCHRTAPLSIADAQSWKSRAGNRTVAWCLSETPASVSSLPGRHWRTSGLCMSAHHPVDHVHNVLTKWLFPREEEKDKEEREKHR